MNRLIVCHLVAYVVVFAMEETPAQRSDGVSSSSRNILPKRYIWTAAPGSSISCQNTVFTNESPFHELPLPVCPEELTLMYYIYSRAETDALIINNTDIANSASNLDPNKQTVVITHGWGGDQSLWWIEEIKNAILAKIDCNFIVADWSQGAGDLWYPQAASNTRSAGAEIARFLTHLHATSGIQYENIWLIGFSLGAHIMGHTGMSLEGSIGRITGLDPAGPWFEGAPVEVGLNPSSAVFVDVIHTDGEGLFIHYGLQRAIGHSDFYPNGGSYQPGCFSKKKRSATGDTYLGSLPLFDGSNLLACSHHSAIYYFIGTIADSTCHLANQICDDERNLPGSCTVLSNPVQVGFSASREQGHGKFYFETAYFSPYCRRGNK